jgi:hypothetical protein
LVILVDLVGAVFVGGLVFPMMMLALDIDEIEEGESEEIEGFVRSK